MPVMPGGHIPVVHCSLHDEPLQDPPEQRTSETEAWNHAHSCDHFVRGTQHAALLLWRWSLDASTCLLDRIVQYGGAVLLKNVNGCLAVTIVCLLFCVPGQAPMGGVVPQARRPSLGSGEVRHTDGRKKARRKGRSSIPTAVESADHWKGSGPAHQRRSILPCIQSRLHG